MGKKVLDDEVLVAIEAEVESDAEAAASLCSEEPQEIAA